MNYNEAFNFGMEVHNEIKHHVQKVKLHDDAMVEGEHSIRMFTKNRTLRCEVMEGLMNLDRMVDVTYLGEAEESPWGYQWLLELPGE